MRKNFEIKLKQWQADDKKAKGTLGQTMWR